MDKQKEGKIEEVKEAKKDNKDLNQDILDTLKDIQKTNKEMLELNKSITDATAFLKKHFKFRIIFNAVKWTLLVIILLIGFLSLSSVFDYLRDNIDHYEGILNQVLEFRESFDEINIEE